MASHSAACLSILVVEDHDALRESIVALLLRHGHRAVGVASAESMVDFDTRLQPELYLIDLNLPGEDGISLTRRLRASHPKVGIIIVSARTAVVDKVAGYGCGADIYLPKPIDPDELVVAIASLARRIRHESHETSPQLTLSLTNFRLVGAQGEVSLTATEAQLLDAFSVAPEQLLERWQAAINLGMDLNGLSDTSLEKRVANLRRKLRDVGAKDSAITAVRGVGYKLCVAIRIT
jgi:DNA-binding response OmpR family regulator